MEEENRKRKVKQIRNVVVIPFAAFLLFKIIIAFKDTTKALEDDLPSHFVISSEDSNLIVPSYRKKMKVIEVKRTKLREDLLVLSFDEQYITTLEKLRVPQGISLTQAIHITEGRTDQTTGVTYSVWPFQNYTYKQKAGSSKLASNIYLLLSGDSIQKLRFTDSVVSFSLQAKTISLRYAPKGPTDIYLKGNETFLYIEPVPMDLMFLKKDGTVYFIVLTNKAGKELPKRNVIDEIFQ